MGVSMKDEYIQYYLKALEACDNGLITKDKIEAYIKYLQEKAKESHNA